LEDILHDKRTRFTAFFILTVVCLSAGWWVYAWLSDALLYWGLSAAPSRLLGVAGAICLLAAMIVRPIPVKVRTVAALYVYLFSLLTFALQCALAPVWPAAANLGWLWQGGVAALAASAAVLCYGFFHGRKLVLKRYDVETSLPVPGGELRIALISDMHMGLTIDETRLRRQMERLAAEKPDLLIVAGDLVDDRTSPEQMRAACDAVGGVPATYGAYFVYGNHDLASHGPVPPYTRAELDRALSGAGIRVLDDARAETAGITMIGRHDAGFSRHPERASLLSLLEGVDKRKPVILIDHQPREWKDAASKGVTLQLSGHTHGGQVWPMSWLSRLSGVAYGHKRIKNAHLIVSSGMGNRGSILRSGSTAEMVLIRLIGRAD
jgi:predicted MPP superfamily phosphohydrolase